MRFVNKGNSQGGKCKIVSQSGFGRECIERFFVEMKKSNEKCLGIALIVVVDDVLEKSMGVFLEYKPTAIG